MSDSQSKRGAATDPEDEEEAPSILEEEPEGQLAEGGGARQVGPLEDLLDGLTEPDEDADDSGEPERVTVDHIVDTFEHRSIGALISVIALISALPLVGGIPGVTIITATLMLLIIGQSVARRRGGIWVPRMLGERSISVETLQKAVDKSRSVVRRIDRWLHPRMEFLTHGRVQRLLITIAIVLLTLSYYPLNFIPYAVSAPSFGVLAFGLALMTGDGLLALFGYLMCAATLGIGFEILSEGADALF